MTKFRNIISLFLVAMFLTTHNMSYAKSDAELAKAAQNPIANMISLPLQYNFNTGIGPGDEAEHTQYPAGMASIIE